MVTKVRFLTDIKDELINNITITLPLDSVSEDFVVTLNDILDKSPGNADLFFHILDPEGQMNLKLHSRTRKITVQRQLIELIEANEAMSYRINSE